ncbi:conserved hypothetical protein [Pediculus humanus corporis]|uniref:Chromosome transmission fidelity protein n=1 Tax=Pediculus humanus subsp. corporis TaxID=121224 RepID=E0VL31_PEDHC|nr:uncharacterized protein Phum_PHUM280430 [Pediculus humanus corporis]EEB14087.1 conserved hypothetical protein [Pediculus humanus corporis]
MQITIESADNDKLKEWGLLEFQGSFLTRDDEPLYNQFIGDLNYNKDGTPFFIVGHHILYGEEVKLQKPFAVIQKQIDSETKITSYLVQAVIRKKILFKTRPKPIICNQVNKNNS